MVKMMVTMVMVMMNATETYGHSKETKQARATRKKFKPCLARCHYGHESLLRWNCCFHIILILILIIIIIIISSSSSNREEEEEEEEEEECRL
jgi:hypothetical protein